MVGGETCSTPLAAALGPNKTLAMLPYPTVHGGQYGTIDTMHTAVNSDIRVAIALRKFVVDTIVGDKLARTSSYRAQPLRRPLKAIVACVA